MTREEEINNASYSYWTNNYANIEFIDEEEKELHTQDIQESFINGAKWADRTMIDKACDLLRDLDVFTEDFINDFRKVMEGGEK